MKDTKTTRILTIACRWIVGLVFLFSSFVKGVDPMGTAFKVTEYMVTWSVGSLSFEWATPMALPLSMGLIVCEFWVGVMMITGCFRRFGAWMLSAMMLFFTATTLIDAITNQVTDCGCFGDAVKLTNWQTFWKNVALDIPTVWIFLTRNRGTRPHFERDAIVSLFAVAAMVIFGCYNVNNEPCIDFRAWKVGNQMIEFGDDMQVKSYLTYTSNKTGESMEFPSEELMKHMEDPEWEKEWEWTSSRVEDPTEIKADGFSMLDLEGTDMASDLIGQDDYLLIATIHHLDKVKEEGIKALQRVSAMASENGLQMVILSSALPEEVQAFLHDTQLENLEFYFADATAIETMARSNPGFVLLKHAKVMGKWHYRNYRDLQEYDFNE